MFTQLSSRCAGYEVSFNAAANASITGLRSSGSSAAPRA